ncbi:hypothetical protein Nepgr_029345 [Nepenthes gracilis]|uniref:Uncharacterized protein n=1 Tax=Nepenthes gracilis TaxID=150966 RepID=A0AAD3TDT0_NEPGR|nr:hypothetical protein Nepgr_029345 [Nepenthes gracilis]
MPKNLWVGAAGGYRKKKSGTKDGKDESGKVYECRFCSLKFCKSQALGERETETLNRARQLVYSNENLDAFGSHSLGAQHMPQAGYHRQGMYPTRLFSGSSSSTMIPPGPPPPPPAPHQPPYLYTSPPRLVSYATAQYPTAHPPNHDYFVGHALPGNSPHFGPTNLSYGGGNAPESNYTCIGAPIGFVSSSGPSVQGSDGGGILGEGYWGARSYVGATTSQRQRLDSSSINRFQDGL